MSFSFRWVPFLIFQLFIALLVLQPTAWAGLLSLSVDANGDSVFNGEEEKLSITFTTDALDDNERYEITVDGKEISSVPDDNKIVGINETVVLKWDGKLKNQNDILSDGDYTIRVNLVDIEAPRGELTATVTIDTTAPEISIGVSDTEFSPVLGSISVYYSLSENATMARLEFQRAPGDATIGRPIEVSSESGNHTYNWDGKDSTANRFADGQYTLKLWVKDKGGNEATTEKSETITIDSTDPRITGIFLSDTISLVNSMFVNASIPTVSFTAEDEDGTGIDLTGSDTEILIKHVDGTDINGTLTYGNRVTFSLSNPLDELTENGSYEVSVSIADKVGNVTSRQAKFTFDNAAPTLKSVATNKGEFVPGSGLKGLTNFVEAALEDNIGLNLDDSSILLRGPGGNLVLGQQTRPGDNKIRWQLLLPLSAKDGLQDGQYTVEIVGTDKAGNQTSPIQIPFLFDNLAPELVSLRPTRDGEPFNILGDTVYYNLPLSQFVATFNDGEFGTGIDFTGQETTRITFGTPKQGGGVDVITGRAFPDLQNGVLSYILDAPLLKSDGSQDGNYIINVKATDSLGNTKTYTYQVIYDTQLPTLKTTVPAANQTVSNLSEVVVELNEVTSGIDFVQSNFQLIRGAGENQVEIPVNISNNGTDTATLTLLQPIALDGSDDGTYTIEVTPTDLAGNIGAVVRRQFYLVSQIQPQVQLTIPETGTVNNLSNITVEIANYIGSGINFDASTITVRNAQGLIVPQSKVEADAANNQLTWSTEATIPRNGTADGEYTIIATFVDFSGNRFTQSFPLILDTQFPAIDTVEVGTDPQFQLSLDSATDVAESFSQITVAFNETDVDFENTVVSLAGPDGTEIALHRSNDGAGLLTLNFQNLAKLGTYTLTVTPRDNIGNVSETPFIYRFHLNIAVPVVTTVLIGGQSGAVVYVNGSAGEIIATLTDTTGIGIAVGEDESNIVVTSANGLPVPGVITTKGNNQLIWRPIALPTDGSADGQYTVAVTPVDKAGRTGDVAYRSFIYDTQEPRIAAATTITLHQPISYISSLTHFQLTVEDVGPALLDLADQTIGLQKKNGEAVIGQITHDGVNQLFFTLSAPLPTDGSADGEYVLTVNLVDKAGNPYRVEHDIFYDSQVPKLSSVTLNTETPLDLTPYQVTDLSESINKLTLNFVEATQVDFENTVITLMGPDASVITLTLENNGVDQLTASFVSLTQGGLYTLSVTPQDKAGNAAQGAVSYPFRLQFEVPELSSVKANTVDTSVELIQHEIIEISVPIGSLTLDFTDALRIDPENTRVVLTGPNAQEISITQEDNEDSQLIVRFISLTQSGLYTLAVTPHDRSGNVAQSATQYQFRLNIVLPAVSSVLIDGKLSATIYVNSADANIVATFTEPTGVGLALGNDGSTIVVSDAEGLPVSGATTSNGANQLTWTPTALPADGSADGKYTVAVTPVDKAGRTGDVAYRSFIYDTQEPRIAAATTITLHQPISYISSLTQFQFTVEDVGPALLDLADQTIGLQNKDGEAVQGQITHDGINQLFFTLSAPLPTDGSADGEYTLTVDLVDKAGNPHQAVHNIFYDSQAPRLSSVSLNTETPLNLTPYQVTDLSESISKLTMNFDEMVRVDFENTVITLMGPEGSIVPLSFENNGIDQISASFVALIQGGLYTLSVTPQDIAGNVAQGAVPYPFRLKFEVPDLASVKANTVDTSVELIQHEIIEISAPIGSLTLDFTDALRIDPENTRVVLTGPNAQEISITQEDNEDSQLIVRFISLTQSGLYTLAVTPHDRSGNVAQSATQYQFRLNIVLPAVSSVLIDGKLSATIYVNSADANIVATFTEPTGVGLALGNDGSTIVVSDAEGLPVSGATTSNGANQLTWTPTALPADGSADGQYTVAVTPVDKAGRIGDVAYRSFIYDTQEPRIAAATTITLHQPISYISSLTQFQFTVEDVGPALLDLADQTIGLQNKDGEAVQGQITHDGINQLFFTLSAPLPTDGSADGEYVLTVNLVDKAGNPHQAVHNIFYDSQAPEISSVSLNAETPLDLTPYQVTDLSETVNKLTLNFVEATQVDFENTVITLMGPDAAAIPLTLENNGVDQLTVSFVSLIQSGEYTLSVTPQDKAGNAAQGAVSYPFRLEFEVPGLSSVKANTTDASVELTAYEITEISESISSFTLQFTDAARVDFENTIVRLATENGQEIPVTLEEHEGSQLIVRFVSLVQSGLYTFSVTPRDVSGNVSQGAVPYPFRLKFEVPGLSSVKANTSDASVELTPYEIVEISETIGSLTLEFIDATRIDFENTRVVLTGPDGQEISVSLENGESQLMVRFVALTQSGLYTLAVTPQDKAGNTAQSAIRYQFRLDTALPTVSSVLIDGKPGSTVYVRSSIPRIDATISDPIGVGVSLGDGGSTIVVTNAEGVPVSGTTSANGTNQLTWIPIPLPTDGSADGEYTVAITPVDKSGRSGAVVNRQFIYDTQAPRITAAEPVELHAPVSYIGSGLNRFALTIEDVGPAGLVASQVIALLDAAGKPVSADRTYDELTSQLYLTLSKPFASDGSVDGPYSLNVSLSDRAGNTSISRFSLVYDSKAPQVSSVEVNTAGTSTELAANEITELSESISTITIKFSEATLVDFANTQVSLLDPDNQTIPITQEDDGVSQMTLSFADLTQIGQYTLSVTPQDIAENVAQSPIQFEFNLEFILPGVESVNIGGTVTLGSGDIAYVNANNLVIAATLLDRSGAGLSFDSNTGSDIIVATLDGENLIVPGATASIGTDLIVWEPITLSTDGSSDGRYAVYVYPVDKKGREGGTAYREFVYDTQEPEITSADPIDLSQPVSYIGESLTQFRFTVQDVGPADLTLEDQKVSLRNQNGTLIPTKITTDSNNQLFLTLDEPLPLDGSRDGEYTVVIAFSDKAGNVLSVEHPIIYDTQAPTLVNTVPADGAQLTEDVTQIQVNLNDEGESGIDWDATTVTLIDPNEVEISGELASNGKTQLTLKTNQLVEDGRYKIRVQAVDRAGNGSRSVFENSFLLSRLLPAVISTSPSTAPKDEAFTNEEVEQIEISLKTTDANHLSTVRLLNAEGQVIAGQQQRGTNKLIYRLVRPLATDGSEDGVYTIEFKPISASGREGAIQNLTFTYDTQTPEVELDAINLIVAEPEVNNSLTEIRVVLIDNQAGIDWEDLDEEWLAFERLSPNAAEIAGRLSYETGEQDTLIFRLTVPLADDGSADGEYRVTVTPIDKAGNGDETYKEEFTYDTSPPVIDPNSLLINDAPLLTGTDVEDYPSSVSTTGGVVIQASVSDAGLGVDLSRSQIVVRDPNGQEISGTTRQNGVDTISFKSDGLNVEGIYQVTITGIGNDSELLGFVPKGSIATEFLYETTAPTAVVTNDGGKTEFTDEAVPFEGTAADLRGSRPRPQGEGEIPIPASGVWLVEIIGTGPDGQPIEPVPAEDESNAQEEPWSRWSADFLPARSGEYDLDLRVTDKAGNYAVYDVGEVTMSVSFSFRGKTFGWPNPLRHSKGDVAFFSFDLNAAAEERVELALYIYDWGGDMVYSKKYSNITPGERNDTQVKWNLENQSGTAVARGLYVFRLEAVNGAGNRANAVGKILVVD